jgi:hypothetical protein
MARSSQLSIRIFQALIGVLLLCLMPTRAVAKGTTTESAVKTDEQRVCKNQLHHVNKACGTTMTCMFDLDSLFKDPEIQSGVQSPYGRCGEPLRYLYLACQDARQKQTIQGLKLKSYLCLLSDKPKSVVRMAKGELTYGIAFQESTHESLKSLHRDLEKLFKVKVKFKGGDGDSKPLVDEDPYYDSVWQEFKWEDSVK